mgnify:CR=1 FL=1
MLNFTLHNPTKVIFGKGTIRQIADEIPRDAGVMLTYGLQSARKYEYGSSTGLKCTGGFIWEKNRT